MCHCFPSGERRWFGRDTVATSYFNPRSPCGERLEAELELRCARQISIHASRVGSDVVTTKIIPETFGFQSTLPVWGATPEYPDSLQAVPDFNPRSPCGERQTASAILSVLYKFQSTLPVWGATDVWDVRRTYLLFQSTLPVWGATAPGRADERLTMISIHAPRVGSDFSISFSPFSPTDFNPRSPCGERPF